MSREAKIAKDRAERVFKRGVRSFSKRTVKTSLHMEQTIRLAKVTKASAAMLAVEAAGDIDCAGSIQQPWCVSNLSLFRTPAPIYIARGHANSVAPRQAFGAQSPNIPGCGDGAFCGRADVAATAAIAPAIGSNPSNTQTPETPHEVHLYETERAPHRR